MAPYFNVTDNAHKAMLPQAVRSHIDLTSIAALAEAMVIGYYTVNPPYYLYTAYLDYSAENATIGGALTFMQYVERGLGEDITASGSNVGLRVYLRGYKKDAADPAVDANLKAALVQTIAGVIRWMVLGWGREPGLNSASGAEGKARSFRANSDDAFQPDWNMLLIPFDSKPIPWGL